jgi:hypothetical protein
LSEEHNMRVFIGAAAVIAAMSGSLAQAAAPPAANQNPNHVPVITIDTTGQVPKGATVKPPPSFDAMMGAIDKMFPPQPEPDPARLALARTSVQAMWPDGAYAKMMTGFVGNLFTGVMQMKKSDLAPIGSKAVKTGASAAADNQTIHDKAAAKDPYFDQRMAAMRGIIDEEIGKMSVVIDPRMREGLARSLAHRFDAKQLADINAFFATPSGHALASEYAQLWFEPDTLRSMMSAFPEMMKLMPDAMQKIKAVNAKFPKPAEPPSKAVKH